MASIPPTAANILASLGVKGAVSGIPAGVEQKDFAGFVPTLDKNGQLNVKFIPSSAAELTVRPLGNVMIVDQASAASEQTGSVVAPFKTIDAAAAAARSDSSGRCALLLMPGFYPALNNSIAQFSQEAAPNEIFIIGLGECVLDASTFNISGLASGGKVFLQGISIGSNIQIVNADAVYFIGGTNVDGNALVGERATIWLSSEAWVRSTDAGRVAYLSQASRVGNTSHAPGETVGDALERLWTRKVRVANVKAGDSGFAYDSSSFTDITAESAGEYDVFDLRSQAKVFADGINRLVRLNKNVNAETVVAQQVTADVVKATKLKVDALDLGDYKVLVDTANYLVIESGSAEEETGNT